MEGIVGPETADRAYSRAANVAVGVGLGEGIEEGFSSVGNVKQFPTTLPQWPIRHTLTSANPSDRLNTT